MAIAPTALAQFLLQFPEVTSTHVTKYLNVQETLLLGRVGKAFHKLITSHEHLARKMALAKTQKLLSSDKIRIEGNCEEESSTFQIAICNSYHAFVVYHHSTLLSHVTHLTLVSVDAEMQRKILACVKKNTHLHASWPQHAPAVQKLYSLLLQEESTQEERVSAFLELPAADRQEILCNIQRALGNKTIAPMPLFQANPTHPAVRAAVHVHLEQLIQEEEKLQMHSTCVAFVF
jgi:hypothetical protein